MYFLIIVCFDGVEVYVVVWVVMKFWDNEFGYEFVEKDV